jgi:hypothetical protein
MIGLIAAAALATAPPPVATSPWVTLKGQIVWPKANELPEPAAVNVVKDFQHCCGAGPLFEETFVVDPKSRGLKGVIVWLRPDDTDPRSFFPKDRIHPDLVRVKPQVLTVDMPRCQFVPRVLAARVGDTLVLKNSAPVPHCVKLYGAANEFARVLMPEKEPVRAIESLKIETVPMTIDDPLHPWMRGFLRVFDHPYFAVTDADGRFEIPKVPVGNWRIVYWHETGFHKGKDGRLGFPVVVKNTGAATQTLPPLEYAFPKLD